MNIKKSFAGHFFYFVLNMEQCLILTGSSEWLVSYDFFFFFFDLRNATTINSVEYQLLNVFFSFDLTLFFFDLAAISLISLFGITCKYSNFSS